MSDKTAELLEKLADKLGVTAEHLWGVLVKQAPIDAISQIIFGTAFLVAAIISMKWAVKKSMAMKAKREDFDDNPFPTIVLVISMIVCGALITGAVINSGDILAGLFNPEYWALQHLPLK